MSGDYKLEDSVYILFTTRAFATGIPGVLSAATVAVYEDVTATPIETSIAVTETLNSINGLNAVTIAAQAASGYNAGGHYHVVIEAGTVDSVSVVGEVVGSFTIAASTAAQDLANATDGLSALKAIMDTSGVVTASIAANAITAAAINADAITAAKIADGAFVAANFAASSLDGKGDWNVGKTGYSLSQTFPSNFSDMLIEVSTGHVTSKDLIAVSGSATAADNLEAQYDGSTGLTGDLYPATQLQMGGLTSGTAAINTVAASFNSTVGGTPTNAYTDTHSENLVYHIVPPTGSDTDIDYTFDVGGNGVPVSVTWVGYATSNGDTYTVWAWNYTGTPAWEQVGTITAQNGTTPVTNTYSLTNQHVGTGASIGEVKWRVLSADGTNFATDRLLCSYAVVAQSVGYADGAIWVDSGGTAGAVDYVNGTADNPCPWANALTISASLGITRFHIVTGETITLAAGADAYTLLGDTWLLALGSQSIDGLYAKGATVTGVGEATTTQPIFEDCLIGAATIPPAVLRRCGLGNASGTFTAAADFGDYIFIDCFSEVPGAGAPGMDFSAITGTTGINNRRWSGGATYILTSNCTLSHEVVAGGGTTITTGGGNAEIRGITRDLTVTMSAAETVQFVGTVGDVTLNGTTTATVNLDGVMGLLTDNTSAATVTDQTTKGLNVDAILVDTGTTLDDHLTDIKGTSFVKDTHSLIDIEGYVDILDDGTSGNVKIASDVAATLVDTGEIGTAGAGLTDLGGMSTGMKAEINTEADTALTDIHLDHLLAADYDPASKPGVATALLNELIEDDGGVSRYTANALENAPSGTGASAATIADAVWEEAQADHVAVGSFGEIATEIAAILVDTNELQSDDVPGLISAVDAKIDIIDTNVDQIEVAVITNAAGVDIAADIIAMKVDTAAILSDTGTDGVVVSAATQNAIADALLDRDMSTGTDSGSTTVRTARQALRMNRNKVAISGGTMTVYKENDTTASHTAAVTTTAGNPVTAVDPAGP